MNKYVKTFLLRGLIFGGLGPIILGIIYVIISINVKDFSLSAKEVCLGICSIYILAFLQAGASVFNQIEHWPIMKSLFFHFFTIYIAYVSCYLLNRWLSFRLEIVGIFTLVFVILYFIIWITVYLAIKLSAKKFNQILK